MTKPASNKIVKGKQKTSSIVNTALPILKNKSELTNSSGTVDLGKGRIAGWNVISDKKEPFKLSSVEVESNKGKGSKDVVREPKNTYKFNANNLYSDMKNVAKVGLDNLNKFLYYITFYYVKSDELSFVTDTYEKVVKEVFGKTVKWKLYFTSNDPIYGPALGGQQTAPDTSLMEHGTNGFDANKELTVKEIMEKSNEPEPKTQKEFVDLALKHGYHFGLGLGMYFEGDLDSNLNCIIRDIGVGINPSNFFNTILSLGKGNKFNTGYQEGRHNFGSTSIWGHISHKVICSRMSTSLSEADGRYGITIMKKRYVDGDTLHQECVYMTLDDEIPSFSCDSPVEFLYGSLGDTFEHGTAIKLFGLGISKYGANEKSTKRFLNIFNSNIVEPLYATEIFALKELKNGKNHRRVAYGRVGLIDEAYNNQFSNSHSEKKIAARSLVKVDFSKECFSIDSKEVNASLPSSVSVMMDVTILNSEYTSKYLSNDVQIKDGDYLYGSLDSKTIIYCDYGQRHAYDTISTVKNNVSLKGYPRIMNNVMITVYLDDLPSGLKAEILSTNREQMKSVKFTESLKKFIYKFFSEYSLFASFVKSEVLKPAMEYDKIKKQLFSDQRIKALRKEFDYCLSGRTLEGMDDILQPEDGYSNISNKCSPYSIFYLGHYSNGVIKKKRNLYVTKIDYNDYISHKSEYSIMVRFVSFNGSADDYLDGTGSFSISGTTKDGKVDYYNINNPSNYVFNGITITHSMLEKKLILDGVRQENSNLCLAFCLTPDLNIVKDNQCYGLRIVITKKGKRLYEGTSYILTSVKSITHKFTPRKTKESKNLSFDTYINVPEVVLVSNTNEYVNALSYKKVLQTYNINMDDSILLGHDRSKTVLDNIFINLDNVDFKYYLNTTHMSMEDCVNKCFVLAYRDYLSILLENLKKKASTGEKLTKEKLDNLSNDEDDEFRISLRQSSRSISNVLSLGE